MESRNVQLSHVWRERLDRFSRSCLSIAEFCRRHQRKKRKKGDSHQIWVFWEESTAIVFLGLTRALFVDSSPTAFRVRNSVDHHSAGIHD
jgi:hypothetical protein